MRFNKKPFSSKKIALISVDGLRADRFNMDTMPRLFDLLSTGIWFQHAYSNFPYTPPAHATMLTSLYACNHGKTDQSWVLPANVISIAQLLENANVGTAARVSAIPLLKERSGFDRGFSTYVQDNRPNNFISWQWSRISSSWLWRGLPDLPFLSKPYITAQTVLNDSKKIIREINEDKFFLFIHIMDLHDPRNIVGVEGRNYSLLNAAKVMHKYYKNRHDYSQMYLDENEIKIYKSIYDANVRMVDSMLGPYIDSLLGEGFTVLLTSDHGENAYERKLRNSGIAYPGKTFTLYETEVHIPLVIFDKRIQETMSYENAVSLVDLAPTIADLMDVEGVSQFQGQAIWKRTIDSPIFMERLDWYSRKEAAWLKWPWKLIMVPRHRVGNDFKIEDCILELYNIEKDPNETKNLYIERRDIINTLVEEILRFLSMQTDYWIECHHESNKEDKIIRERMRMLGYVD